MSRQLEFSVSEIKEKGSLRFDGEVPAEEFQGGLGEGSVLSGPVRVELDLRPWEGEIKLRGRAFGKWTLVCSRCLEPAPADFDAKLDASFPRTASAVDAKEEVRQALILAVPIQVFCKPDCKGLCGQCGNNRNEKECHNA